jgi:hypothetical protein
MNKKLDEKLCKLAPHLFIDRHASMQTTCMVWGFDCGDGWYKLLEKAALKLEPLIVAAIAKDPGGWEFGFYRATQVKEKYGTLRFYMFGATYEMQAIIGKAERQSSTTCETCGKKGELRGRGWLYMRCAPCWKQKQAYV